ncbi:MAG TPA: response regulator [Pirellulales bacterium]|nr:response regulator [Pirellulales bacterium]
MSHEPTKSAKRRILVIDDNHDIHADFRKVFDSTQAHESKIDQLEAELFGGGGPADQALPQVEIDSAYHGEQGIQMALDAARQGRPYSMAFVDVRMPPGIDGIQTIKGIWKEQPDLQCVICTAYSDYDWGAIHRELGTSSNLLILKKPFDAVEVLQLAQALTEKAELAHTAKQYLTELEQQVQQLEQARLAAVAASRAKGEFLANMSHELRTPLNGVIGMGQLLMDTPLTPQQQRYVDAARLSAKVLLQLINDVLDFSKIEAGRLELETIDFDPSTVIERVISIITDQARQKGLDVLCFVDPNLPATLRGDPSRWQQILINLLANSVKFTAAGHVSLDVAVESVREGELIVRCVVRDTGIGIPADRLPLLFQCFSQVDSSTTRKYGGTGLGLSICKKLAEMMGGEIGVESEPGQGATFWFTVRFGYSATPVGRYAQTVAAWDGLRVLLVGDSPTIVSSIQRQIGAWQIACELVGDGAVAAARLNEAHAANQRYQIAIVDGTLAEVKLDDVTRAAINHGQETAVLAIVPPGDERADQPSTVPGIAGYLCKPITASRLFNAMMSALQPSSQGAVEQPAPARSRRRSREPVVMKDTRILLVEDNEINQQVASELLRAAGYRCDIRGNGREAVETLAHAEYDVVLMDCQMPEMDGYEATRAVRQMEQSRGGGRRPLPIIALTANAMAGDRQRCLEAGMTDYVKKPLNRHELIATLERHISDAAGPVPAPPATPAELARAPVAPALVAGPAVTPRVGSPAATTPPAASAAPPLDCQSLIERFLGDWEFVEGILEKFQQQVDVDLEALERSILDRNAEQAALLAHRIKGAAANVSATEVSRIAAELERMGRAAMLDNADERLAALRSESRRLDQFIRDELPAWTAEST